MTGLGFRFQPLLDLADQREEQQMLALGTAAQAERAAQDALDTLVEERDRQVAEIDCGARVIDPEQRQAALAYIAHLDRRIGEQAVVIAELQSRVDAERAALVEVVQERRSLERLRDNDEALAAEEAGRKEASVVDDLNMTRHARQSRGEKGVA